MPGIVGIITTKPRQQAEAEVARMLAKLCHEPFYVSGTYSNVACGVYIGWVARSPSFAEKMPLVGDLGNHVLVFSGEDYREPGSGSNADQPCDYLLKLSQEDANFPASVNGRFHGVMVNVAERRTTIFNDRYGMHRVYYSETNDGFYFAAEAKAILAVRGETRAIDQRGLGEYLSCGCVLEDRSLFKNINLLPIASAWTFRDGRIENRAAYFDRREWEEQTPLSLDEYYEQLRDTFSERLPWYFRSEHTLGISLTGGLDSRMIMAWQKAPPGALPCYSFSGPFRESQDVLIAKRVAQACGQPHQNIPVGDEFLSRFHHYAERTVYLTDGSISPNHSPDLYINEIARQIGPVRMTGNYGGEVLRSVRAFKPEASTSGIFAPEVIRAIEATDATYNALLGGHPLTFAVFRQAPWHHYGLQALEQTQLSLRSPFLDNDFVRIVFRAPRSTLNNNDISLRLIAEGNPALSRIPTDRALGGDGNFVSSALAHQWMEFTFKAEYAYDYGMPQSVAAIDHAFSWLHLERLFLGRHKFFHFRVWYRDRLAKVVRETLLDPRSLARPYLRKDRVENVVVEHTSGRKNYTTEIHQLLALEFIHRLFID